MNKDVVFWREDVIKIDNEVISDMKKKASMSIQKKFRYCLHESESSNMQEMIFVNQKGDYLRPHKHGEAAETQVILEGKAKIIIFGENGKILEVICASDEDCRIYRIEKGLYHMTIPVTDMIVTYEVREGKFSEKTNIFPDWAPHVTDTNEIANLYNRIERELKGES